MEMLHYFTEMAGRYFDFVHTSLFEAAKSPQGFQ